MRDVTHPFNVRAEILTAIGKTSDENLKMILLLMLGILDEISGKIDTVISDEQSIKTLVLNGHSDAHHAHHDWIANRIAHQGRCEWANRKCQEETEFAATKKSLATKLAEAMLQQVGIIIITALAVAAGFTFIK
jgi:hypothetical protein